MNIFLNTPLRYKYSDTVRTVTWEVRLLLHHEDLGTGIGRTCGKQVVGTHLSDFQKITIP